MRVAALGLMCRARSLDMDEMRERVADLEKRLQVAKVDNQR